MTDPVLHIQGLSRHFMQGGKLVEVLHDVALTVQPGESVALLGPSGSGKSTLLQAAGLLEQGYSGEIFINGQPCHRLSARAQTLIRRTQLGFVYQFHHLLPDFTAEENVLMPQLIAGVATAKARTRARDLLTALGLGARLTHRPAQLSGGEQQRVAVARALANKPALILADEPTGNLDTATGQSVLAAFLTLTREVGAAALIATHNEDLATTLTRTVRMVDGRLVG